MSKIATQHSSFWLDEDLFDDELDNDSSSESRTDLQRISRLAAVRRAISNFVSILTGKNLPVQYSSGKQSKTDGETVIISAEEDPAKFDIMVGLALHEASHVLLTKFDILKSLEQIHTSLANRVIPHAWTTPANDFVIDPHEDDSLLHVILPKFLVNKLGELPRKADKWTVDYTGKITRNYGSYGANSAYLTDPWWDNATKMLGDIKFIMNILEDRRIDWYVYRTCGGYRPYYDAIYNHYFFTTEIGRNLRFNPEWRAITIENYITRLLYAYHPDNSVTAMPGLKKLMQIADIPNIDRIAPENDPVDYQTIAGQVTAVPIWWVKRPEFQNMPVIWQVACNVYSQILKYCDLAQEQAITVPPTGEQGVPSNDPSQLPNMDGGMPGGTSEDEDGEDMTPKPVEKQVKGTGKKQKEVDGKFNAKKAQKDRQNAEKMMKGEIKKKKVKADENTAIDALEQAQSVMVDLKGDGIPYGRAMVTRKLTDSLLEQDWFIFKRWNWKNGHCTLEAEASIAAGRRMGAILHHRLQVRNDPIITKQTRLLQGGLDRRLLAQLGMDITSVFQKSRTDQHRPVMLHLTLDASGSMQGKKWHKVRTVAVALAYLGSKLKNVDTVISIRGGNEMPIVSVIFDSRRDQFNRFVRYMRVIEPNGSTPEGLCYKATMDLILECKDTHDVYFINFSDGQPSFSLMNTNAPGGTRRRRRNRWSGGGNWFDYDGEVAFKHTRQMVQMMKDNGVKVLSYFIEVIVTEARSLYGNPDNDKIAFRKMYGEDAEYVNVENAAEVLRTLNKLLLARG